MKLLLGEEYQDFCNALECEEAVKGLRVNTQKVSIEAFVQNAPFPLTPIPYVPGGFIVPSDAGAGKHPYHHAGAYYLQDPGAMSAVAAVPSEFWEREGLRILDLCAAPGGKTTQLAALCRDRGGVVWANEYVPARSRVLAGNVERMGLDNVLVTCGDTAAVADFAPCRFDLVVVDAPCSGEGMYRKNELAVSEWSLANVSMCATRQEEILGNAVKCVAPGGCLLYSTCTYSTEENEETVAKFLRMHPDFTLCPVSDAVAAHTADGIVGAWEANGNDLSRCRRFYPHKCPGEGQFVSLMRRDPDAHVEEAQSHRFGVSGKDACPDGEAFLKETLGYVPGRLLMHHGYRCLFPAGEKLNFPKPKPGTGVAVGVPVGEERKGRILPHHHFFMSYGKECLSKCILAPDDPRVTKYLRGEEIDVDAACKGFTAVLLSCGGELLPMGGGKASGGRLKNYYPKGLRIP